MEHVNSGRSWSPELRLFLIRCVRPKERLWRKFGSCGQDTDARISLWSSIQEEISTAYGVYVDIEEIKKTWKNLKDNFLRVKKNSNGQGTTKPGAKKWFFFDELKFLDTAEDLTDYKFRTSLFQTLAPDLATEEAIGPPVKKFRADGDFELVYCPALTDRIQTKQGIPPGVTVLNMDTDFSDIAAMTKGLWGTVHPDCVPGTIKPISEMDAYGDSPSGSVTTSILITEEKPLTGFDFCSKTENFPKKEELCSKIKTAIEQLRADYQKAAVIYLSRRKQAAAGVVKLMQNFDDYAKRGDRRPEEVNKVIKYASKSKQSEFGRILDLLEQYKDEMEPENEQQLIFSCDIDRLTEQKRANEQRSAELKRDVERIQGELNGQPSVIRRTKLRKTLAEAEEEIERLDEEHEKIEKSFEDFGELFSLPKSEE